MHVEGDADLVGGERAAFLEHLGRLTARAKAAAALGASPGRARPLKAAEEPVSKKAEPEEPAEKKE